MIIIAVIMKNNEINDVYLNNESKRAPLHCNDVLRIEYMDICIYSFNYYTMRAI
jgi:hypothetical protein